MTSTATEITVETILDNRRRWAEALRSGEYEQGERLLRDDDDQYCCLGVAAVLVGDSVVRDTGAAMFMPDEPTVKAYGLRSRDSGYIGSTAILDMDGEHVTLDVLNDVYGFTFAEIADLIDDGQVLLDVPGQVSA